MKTYLTARTGETNLIRLRQIEKEFGISLPPSYAEFILANEGGVAHSDDKRFNEALFFSVCNSEISLYSEIFESKKIGFTPVGSNPNCEYIYIELDTGRVFLEDDIVAESFSEFLGKYLKEADR